MTNESEEDGGGGLLGGIAETFNPLNWMNGVLEWGLNMGADAALVGLGILNRILVNIPAPGTHSNPSTWSSPENGWWPGVYEMTLWTSTFSGVLIVGAGTLAFRHDDPYIRRERIRNALISLVMVVLTWQICGFLLHFGAQTSAAFVPSAEEFMTTPNGMAKLVSGGLLAAFLLYAYMFAVILALFAIVAQHVLIHICVAFWPVAWGCKAYGDGTVASLGNFVVWLLGLLIGVNIAQAMFLRLLHLIPWNAGLSGPVLGLITTTTGLAFVGIYLPWMALKTADRAANVGLGMSSVSKHRKRGKKYARKAGERIGPVKERVQRWRGSNTDTTASSTPSVGGIPSTDSPGVSKGSGSSVNTQPKVGRVGSTEKASPDGGRYSDSSDRNREDFERNRGYR